MTGKKNEQSTSKSSTYYGINSKIERDHTKDKKDRVSDSVKYVDFKISVRDILDSYPFYALLIDEDHYILQANKTVLETLLLNPEDIVGRFCPLVIHGVEDEFHGCPLKEAIETNKGVEREVFDEHSKHWLKSAIYPTGALTSEGKRIYFHMVTDITESKHAEMQLKIAHERLRNLSSHLEAVREEERKIIARDLHDETSQLLSSLSANLGALANTLPADADNCNALLAKCQEQSVKVIDELTRMVRELRPAILDDLGLQSSIKSLIEGNLENAGIRVTFKSSKHERKLPYGSEIAIYRVVQEVFNNIVRHSNATAVNVVLDYKKDSIMIQVSDNGIGFSVNDVIGLDNGLKGFGLIGIKERIELLGGNVDIKSSPQGGGTRININVPL